MHLISPLLIEIQEKYNRKPGTYQHGRAIHVSPGKSISFKDICISPSNKQTTKTGAKRRLIPEVDNSDSRKRLFQVMRQHWMFVRRKDQRKNQKRRKKEM